MHQPIAEVAIDPALAVVFEHGWQSWSPSVAYRVGEPPYRPFGDLARMAAWRPEATVPDGAYQGEGLLAVQPAPSEPVHVFGVDAAPASVPSIRATQRKGLLMVTASGEVRHEVDHGPGGIGGALARWADRFAAGAGMHAVRRAPTVWCTWYHYFGAITEADVDENLDAIDRLGLPIEVVQVDDGYQAEVGDWLSTSDRFRSVPNLVARIRDRGRRAGLWLAPFMAAERSELVRRHPDWLIGGPESPVDAGTNWDQALFGLDTTHQGVRDYLQAVFTTMRGWGVDYFKIDFIYSAALPGARSVEVAPVEAYREGLRLIREAIGRDAYLVGCGAPVLPSVGLVDAMRVSPDTAPHWEPANGDMSEPGAHSAVATGTGRAWQQGRFWINDPDCLIVRPGVERREDWAAHVERFGGLRASSDRLLDLDDWGLETTRRLLSDSPTEPFIGSGDGALPANRR